MAASQGSRGRVLVRLQIGGVLWVLESMLGAEGQLRLKLNQQIHVARSVLAPHNRAENTHVAPARRQDLPPTPGWMAGPDAASDVQPSAIAASCRLGGRFEDR